MDQKPVTVKQNPYHCIDCGEPLRGYQYVKFGVGRNRCPKCADTYANAHPEVLSYER